MVRAALCAALLVPFAGAAHAQEYPGRPLRMVVPFAPGGAADILARVIAHRLTESWGQQAIVDNRTGAGGIVGSEVVAKAAPDGHTLLVTSSSHAINASLYAKLPYDTLKDFTSIAPVAAISNVLIVNANVPAKTVSELVQLAKSKPGQLKFGSAGAGSTLHLAAELFKLTAGVDMLHVPYKGNAPAITDLLGGSIDLMFPPVINVVPLQQDKRIRVLAVCTPKRSPALPDVPTLAELGIKGYAFESWWGMFGPARLPKGLTVKLNAEVRRILSLPEVREVLGKQGAEPLAMSADEFTAFVKAETEKMGRLVKASGARID
ncbi:MAG: tripartite tricarboxylate transporter substrate binding protein [Betaproteobacteria bacterium]|nr:tripartite tricarboxylate transporter substrate binding protein [Betaproteobacteria bacterium]